MKTLLVKILALLGFGSGLSACAYGPKEMYGSPYMNYRGQVVSEAGEPVNNIFVSTNRGGMHTDEQGEYKISLRDDAVEVTFIDTDGAENGGDFESASMWVEQGNCSTLSTMVLKLKK